MIAERLALTLACALVTCIASAAVLRLLVSSILGRINGRIELTHAQKYRILLAAFVAVPCITLAAGIRFWRGAEVSAEHIGILGVSVATPSVLTAANAATAVLFTLAVLWTALAARGAIRLAGAIRTARSMQRAAWPADDAMMHVVNHVASRMRMRAPATRISTNITVPAIIGILRPVLLLPVGIDLVITRSQLELIVGHELAHVARRDALVNALQSAVDAILCLCPVTRALSLDIRAERELAADSTAADAFGAPLVLARALERLETMRAAKGNRPRFALAADDEPLLRRIVALAENARHPNATARRAVSPLTELAIVGTVALVAFANVAAVPVTAVDNALRLRTPAAAFRQEIKASDNAGPFTLHVVGFRAVGATIDGKPFPSDRIRQRRDAVRFTTADGTTIFAVQLRPAGGMTWNTR